MHKYRFGELVREVKAKVDRNNNPYEYYIAGDHMDSEDLTIRRRGRFATDDVGPAFIREFRKGQVLYGSRRTYLKKVAVADFDGVTSNTTFVLETKDDEIMPQALLPFIMLTDRFTNWSIGKSKGSTNPYILFSDLEDYEVELPEIEKQRELATVLWQMFRLKERYNDVLRKSDELVQSQFIEQIGTVDNNKHGFQVVSVGDICTVLNGYAFQSKKYVDSGVKIIRITNVQKGEIVDNEPHYYPVEAMESIKDYILNPDDLLMSLTGNCGRVGLLPESMCPAALNQRVACLRINSEAVDKKFLFSTFNMDEFESDCMSAASGSAQKNMSTEWLKQYMILLPPLELQQQFASFVEQSDKSKYNKQFAVKGIREVGDLCA